MPGAGRAGNLTVKQAPLSKPSAPLLTCSRKLVNVASRSSLAMSRSTLAAMLPETDVRFSCSRALVLLLSTSVESSDAHIERR